MELNDRFDNRIIPLVVYGRSFFQLSARDAYRLAKKTIEISSSSDGVVDLIDLYDLLWRKNRDEETIEESTRNMPICYITDGLPEEFLLSTKEERPDGRYQIFFRLQDVLENEADYHFFASPRQEEKNKQILEENSQQHHDHKH
jgi:hypothetical protein